MKIHKSFSKTDLVDILNELDLKIVISHSENKKLIQDKIIDYFAETDNFKFQDNIYKLSNLGELKIYLIQHNPKKSLNSKEKLIVMKICRTLINYCNKGYMLEATTYQSEQDLEDDISYILKFGDLPSVRRVCKLLNQNVMNKKQYTCLISPSVKKEIDQKVDIKNKYFCKIRRGKFKILFV